jgi:hypothetical protein
MTPVEEPEEEAVAKRRVPLCGEDGGIAGVDLDVLEQIGKGSHGVVHKARCRFSRHVYCIKKVRKTWTRP